ncbi:MAG: GntR family transcriptional regulator [Desulfatiglandaceae bacterium]
MESQKSYKGGTAPNVSEDKSPLPRYYRIQMEVRKQIESGVWLPGEMIPPESQIAEDHGVSLGTVRRAIQDLVTDGLLYRMQGKGTLVAGTNLKRETLRYYRFKKDFSKKESSHQINLLGLEKIKGHAEINRFLRVQEDMDLYLLKRVFTRSGKRIVYSISYLPVAAFPALDDLSKHRLERVPLYLTLENKYGIPTKENEELISVEPADTETAEVLQVPIGRCLLRIDMLCFTYRKKPYEYRKSWCTTGAYKLVRTY